MVSFAVALPVLLLFVMMVVEFGNFYEHRRHLQLQADAGALAGAGVFNHCFTDDPANLATANGAIVDQARRYAGSFVGAFNEQVGAATARVSTRINSKTFAVGGGPPDDTVEAAPCTARMLDVKMTEADLPFVLRAVAALFGGLFGDRDVDSINARARIEIQELRALAGSLPLAVPEPTPRVAAVTFVNESGTGSLCVSPPCTFPLIDAGVSAGLRQWRTSAPARITVPAAGARIGLRVHLAGGTTTECGLDLAECFAGIGFIHGSGTTTGAPMLGGAWPTTASCLGPTFTFQYPTSCAVGVAATLDFGPLASPSAATVSAKITGAGLPPAGVDRPMTFSGGVWSTDPAAFVPPAFGGPYDVSLNWAVTAGSVGGAVCTSTGGNPCKGTFTNVQRFFSGSLDRSGSVRAITISEPTSTAVGSPYSLAPGDHDLNVAVGTYFFQAVDADSAGDEETIVLRLVGHTSNNYAIDCDAGRNLRDEITTGCTTPYQRNTRVPGCPAPVPLTPADCVFTEPGGSIGQLRQGMDARFGCPVNRWGDFPIDPTDVRIVPLILTDYGSFIDPGQHLVAVRRFGAFYVTGWDGQSPCAANEAYPFTGSPQGEIWGHFVHNVSTINNGGGDPNEFCDFDPTALDACIAVMTR